MRNKFWESAIIWIWLLPILFLFSCHSGNQEVAKNIHSDTVVIHQMRFDPAVITVNKGDTIVWINKDMVDHTVTEEKSKAFNSDTIRVGTTWKHAVITDANYFCGIHPTMKGKIIVK